MSMTKKGEKNSFLGKKRLKYFHTDAICTLSFCFLNLTKMHLNMA